MSAFVWTELAVYWYFLRFANIGAQYWILQSVEINNHSCTVLAEFLIWKLSQCVCVKLFFNFKFELKADFPVQIWQNIPA